MKTLLTVIVCVRAQSTDTVCDGIEFIYPEEGEIEKDFIARAVKAAKGKYAIVCDQPFKIADTASLLNISDKNNADMICFCGGTAFKVSVLKTGAKDCTDAFSCIVTTVMNCKNLLKTVYTPFYFMKTPQTFNDENAEGILAAAETFGKVKAKLAREIYSYASNMLCDRLVSYYMYTMLAIRNGEKTADQLIAFDGKLKAEIVLYLALEKKFTAAKLQKLRAKNFKISGFTARKFNRLLK